VHAYEINRHSAQLAYSFPSKCSAASDGHLKAQKFATEPTTNAIESLNRVICKSIKTRGSFPTEEDATKLIYLGSATGEGRIVS